MRGVYASVQNISSRKDIIGRLEFRAYQFRINLPKGNKLNKFACVLKMRIRHGDLVRPRAAGDNRCSVNLSRPSSPAMPALCLPTTRHCRLSQCRIADLHAAFSSWCEFNRGVHR